MKKINWGLVSLAYLSLFCVGISDNGRSAIYPDILKTLNLTFDEGALIFSVSSFTGLVSTLSAKYWLPRYGIIIPQRFFSILLFFSSAIFGLSLSYFPSYPLAIFGASLFGVTMGGLSITMNLSIDRAVPQEYRRKFLSGLHSLYGLSSGFAPVILLFLSSWGLSFKHLYFVIATFPLFLLALSSRAKKLSDSEIKALDESKKKETPIPLSKKFIPSFVLSFYVCSEVLLSSRFILITRSYYDISAEAAQSYLSSFFIFLTVGRLLFALIKTKKTNFSILLASMLSTFVLFYLGVTRDPIFLSLIGLSMSIYFPCAMDFIAENFGKSLQQVLPTVMNIVTIQLIGMHVLSGKIENHFGPKSVIFFSIFLLGVAMITLIIQHLKNKKHGSVS